MVGIGQSLVWLFTKMAVAPEPPGWQDGVYTASALGALWIYRISLSRLSGRRCMFHNNCSQFAVQTLREKGWSRGRGEILTRLGQCDGQYQMSFDGKAFCMVTRDGKVHTEGEIALWPVASYKASHASLVAVSAPHTQKKTAP